ncbi:adaptin ear-binding coat-associated protein [Plectosphaerella plurivora]|uniref:Adaptin ear-binding coat-associated protein n=1 Tax=Plectosphaerella plurivora TaxID=936078 RepID=A0A9P8V707_9PEZI|nr:adaptin ear-binding coat-associated protein [Plectosphaerella plurivora]
MEPSIDPATGRALPEDAIQRILFVATKAHVYNIPPAGPKGFTASDWTADNNKRLIFTARLRVLETAWEETKPGSSETKERIKVDILLEDASTGQLFAAAPYTVPAIVEPAVDSSRFFALRVQDPSGRKATLGVGFEERSESFDFGVALQEARKGLGVDDTGAPISAAAVAAAAAAAPAEEKKDYSLKEGETITINLGGKFRRRPPPTQQQEDEPSDLSAFSLAPPPSGGSSSSGAGAGSFLPPPPRPGASHARTMSRDQKRRSAQDLGFDDGQFGEFA